jgi:hypothetical protein
MNRKKVYTGVVLLCVAVLLMLIGQNDCSPVFQICGIVLFGAGLLLYLWGRFFSRDRA